MDLLAKMLIDNALYGTPKPLEIRPVVGKIILSPQLEEAKWPIQEFVNIRTENFDESFDLSVGEFVRAATARSASDELRDMLLTNVTCPMDESLTLEKLRKSTEKLRGEIEAEEARWRSAHIQPFDHPESSKGLDDTDCSLEEWNAKVDALITEMEKYGESEDI